MTLKRIFLLSLTITLAALCANTVFAQTAITQPVAPAAPLFGVPWIDDLMKLGGALMVVVSVLANILPKEWPLTRFLARLGTDMRGVSKVPPAPADFNDTLPGTGP